jgi:hypothetical protein
MAADEEKRKLETVDINSLDLADEEISVNSDADAFAGPPPPDDGDHLVKLSLGDRKVQMGKGKNGQTYFMAHVVAKLVTGPFENRVVFDNASTMIMQGSGTCRAAGVLKALGETVPPRTTAKTLMQELVSRLAGEPQCIVTTSWEAYCPDCEKNVLRQQKRFPANGDGSHRHQLECAKCGSLLTAQARIMAYKPAPTA